MFDDLSKAFAKKIDENYDIRLQFEFSDVQQDNVWQVEVKNGTVRAYDEDKVSPEEIYVLTTDTLERLYNNELSPLTAFVPSLGKDGVLRPLIDIKHKTTKKFHKYGEEISPEQKEYISRLHKFNDFFNKDSLNKVIVKDEYCLKLHDVDGVGLFTDFRNGFHAYFSVKKNEVLEQSPLEFCAFILSGKGTLKVNNEEYQIGKYEYYHVKPNTFVYFENKSAEPLDIFYIGMR